MRTIVLYYSHKGSNRFLANRMAQDLSCEIEEIVPRWNSHILMIMGVNLGIHKLKSKVREYDRVILCGPVWVGKLIFSILLFALTNTFGTQKYTQTVRGRVIDKETLQPIPFVSVGVMVNRVMLGAISDDKGSYRVENVPIGMIFRLDGIDIPNPNHFGDGSASGGILSMLNVNTLANSDFGIDSNKLVQDRLGQHRNQGSTATGRSKFSTEQMPMYMTLNIRTGIKFIGKAATQEIAIGLDNVTNRKNPLWVRYDHRIDDLKTVYQFGFMPDILYRIVF